MTPSPEEYRLIPLTQGQFAKVSLHRFEELSQWKWCASWCNHAKSFRAVRKKRFGDGKRRLLMMHRYILGLDFGDPRESDHWNHDTLDNRDSNLRIATRQQNAANRFRQPNNRSGFKGVSFHKRAGKWRSAITVARKGIHLGFFSTPEAAYAAYCDAAKKHFGEFARQG